MKPWRWGRTWIGSMREGFATRLSWKLAASHLIVVLLTLVLLMALLGLLSFVSAQFTRDSGPSLEYDPDMAELTRVLATLMREQLAARDPAELTALLEELKPDEYTGSGPLGGGLNPGTGIVLAMPGGTVAAASGVPGATPGAPLSSLDPPELGSVLQAALAGERDISRLGPLMQHAQNGQVLVSAYPIADAEGTVIGALGLRTRPPEASSSGVPLAFVVVALSVSLIALLLTAALPAGLLSSGAGFLLARSFGQRLAALEEATEAMARGDLSRRVAVTSRDELGRLAERFNLLAERLQELERRRRAFVANVSHELRTPLAVIRGHVETQVERLSAQDGNSDLRETLQIIRREAETLDELVDDLFTLTRLEEETLPLAFAPVSLAEVAAEAVEAIRPLALAHGRISVSSLISPDLPMVLADRTRLRQVLNNLLHNALRHTPDGGVVVVEARRTGDDVEVAVTDTGTGIDPEELPHIFDRYYRTERSGRHQGGSGLGLAIVKQLVEAQGGLVWAESRPGEGTSIRFTLPIVAGAARATSYLAS